MAVSFLRSVRLWEGPAQALPLDMIFNLQMAEEVPSEQGQMVA
jgi:hypothetical protein